MPRTVHSNGVRSEIKALAVMQLNVPVTPQEINDYVKTGDYAAKYVSMLTNTWGFKFTAQRDGRKVVSYTMVSEPANVTELRAMQPKTKAVKIAVPKEKVAKVAKSVAAPAPKKTKDAVVKAARKIVDKTDPVEKEFGSTGAIGQIDPDWDSIDGVDIKQLV